MDLKDTHITYVHPNLRHLVDRFRVKARERGQRMEEKTAQDAVQFFLFSFVHYNKLHRKAERKDGALDLSGKARMNLSSALLRDIFNELGFDYKAVRDAFAEAGGMMIERRGFHDRRTGRGLCASYRLRLRTLRPGPRLRNRFIDKLYKNAERRKTPIARAIMNEQERVLRDPRTRVHLNKAERNLLDPGQRSALDRVNEGRIEPFHFSEKHGRINHPFQQLPGWVRAKVEIEGEPAVELDLKNSQALVLFRVVAEDLWKGSGRLPEDVKKGLALAEKGIIYEHVQFLTNASTRDEGKKHFNVAVFGCPQESGRDLSRFQRFLRKQIREEFPSVFRWLDARKRSSYKNVHNLLTREESRLVRKAQARMIDAGVPFLNVHDAVYVRERDATFVKECLEDLHFLVNEASCDYLWREWNEESPGDLWKKRAFLVREVKKKDPRSEDTHTSSFTRLGRRPGVGREIEAAFEGGE